MKAEAQHHCTPSSSSSQIRLASLHAAPSPPSQNHDDQQQAVIASLHLITFACHPTCIRKTTNAKPNSKSAHLISETSKPERRTVWSSSSQRTEKHSLLANRINQTQESQIAHRTAEAKTDSPLAVPTCAASRSLTPARWGC
ncbi:hypothetical protein V8G54_029089 [Vigna mungo]|uniref:Uncharacterized protein n=1 Tax=Vigna mungo TaxID=3915 RepID=A0AAQ3MU14_VIGMU